MNGWVKDYRATLEWEWFTDIPTAHLWEYIRLKANHKGESWRGMEIPTGSFISSEARMSVETGLSRQQIRTALKKLVLTNEITKDATKDYTIIRVNKWTKYQGCIEMATNQTTDVTTTIETNRTTSGATTNKNIRNKEYKNKKEIKERKFVPPTLEEVIEYCQSRNSDVNPQRFYDYFSAGEWRDSKGMQVKNWKQKLITWERYPNKRETVEDDTVPVYDDSHNVSISDDELKDILKEMRGR